MTAPHPGLAVQLYTLRSLPLDDALAGVARAGYEAVETVGFHGLDPARLRETLASHGLAAVSVHLGLASVLDVTRTGEQLRALGARTVVVPFLAPEDRPDDAAGWRALGSRLGGLAERYVDDGCRLLYHNHAFELAEHDGRTGLELLLEGAAGTPLGLEPDVAWIARAGHDPAAFLDRVGVSCPLVHAKDLAPQAAATDGGAPHGGATSDDEDGWADAGAGWLPWDRILPAAARAGAELLVVEHDRPRDPLGSVARSRAFLAARIAGG